MKKILAIDPGIKNTGWALWAYHESRLVGGTSEWKVEDSGTIRRGKGVSATKSIHNQCRFFKKMLQQDKDIGHLWVEDYVLYRPSKGAGNALKLVGALAAIPANWVAASDPADVTIVPATMWKRWLTKTHKVDALTKAAEYATVESQHQADAICIGLFGIEEEYGQ